MLPAKIRRAIQITAAVLCLGLFANRNSSAQTEPVPLGDVARNSRQKEQQPKAAPNEAQKIVVKMQAEREQSENAPPGFKSYSTDDYRLLVPALAEVEAREYQGTLLTSRGVDGVHALVLAGTPMPLYGASGQEALRSYALSFAAQFNRQKYTGIPVKVGTHPGYRISIVGQIFGFQVWGTGTFVLGSNAVIPVVCANEETPNTEYLVIGDPHASYANKQEAYKSQAQRFQDERNSARICETVFGSIHLKEDDISATADATPRIRPAKKAIVPVSAQASAAGEFSPLGDIARQSRKEAQQAAEPRVKLEGAAGITSPPPGYKGFELWSGDGSIFLPAGSVLNYGPTSRTFIEVRLGKDLGQIYFDTGSLRDPDDPRNLRLLDKQNGPADEYGGRKETSDPQTIQINGHSATMTRILVHLPARAFLEHKVVIDTGGGGHFAITCVAEEKLFPDLEPVCDTVVQSVRFQ